MAENDTKVPRSSVQIILEYYLLAEEKTSLILGQNVIEWRVTVNGMTDPNREIKDDLVILSPEHGTLIHKNSEYTVLRVSDDGEGSTIVRTRRKPDKYHRILQQG